MWECVRMWECGVGNHLGVDSLLEQSRVVPHLLLRQGFEPGVVFPRECARPTAPEHLVTKTFTLKFVVVILNRNRIQAMPKRY